MSTKSSKPPAVTRGDRNFISGDNTVSLSKSIVSSSETGGKRNFCSLPAVIFVPTVLETQQERYVPEFTCIQCFRK